MTLKKGDLAGLISLLVILGMTVAIFLLAPKTPPSGYHAVELTGSDVQITEPTTGDVTEIKVNATLKEAGFITVHEALGQAPGTIVAVSPYLAAGNYTDYSIPLPVGLDLSLKYFVLLFVDGGNKVYEAGVDLPVMSGNQVIKRSFSLSL